MRASGQSFFAQAGQPRRLGESLDRVLSGLGAPSSDVTATLFGSWDQIFGDEFVERAKPVSLHDSILVIACNDQRWATELSWATESIATRCNSFLSERTAGSTQPAISEVRVIYEQMKSPTSE